ncbi:MAG TPA: TIGR01777 family oxidoreductase [Anaerolineaceae bacterium]|nr:TIGR01777 family oxidoreductase [Anaerolineaceae bacterium]HQH84618.1 TIGR01777 family oxidoreductase [Anaerolineaceae bacterium]
MKVIITGGTGLIGRALGQSLVARGHQVWALTRSPQSAHLPSGIEPVGWDGETPRGWQPLVEQADAVINLAGENLGAGRWSLERKARILNSRLNAGRAVVQALQAATHRPHTLIQASAVGYYGPGDNTLLTESSPAGQDYLAQVAVAWEKSTAEAETLGLRRVVVRTGIVLDAHEGALPRLVLPFRFMAGGPLGSGRQYLPWIHLVDEVNAIQFLLENPSANGPYNLAAPQPLSQSDFGRVLGRVLRRPYWLPAPAFALHLALGEMSTLVLDGQRAVPSRLLELGYSFAYPDLEPALNHILKT